MNKYNISIAPDSIIIEKDAVITFRDFDDIKAQAIEYVERFKDFELIEDNLIEAKRIRTDLNKQSKAINDARIRIKKDVMKPYDNLDMQVKELDKIIDSVNSNIDYQIKAYTNKIHLIKMEKAQKYLEYRINEKQELSFVKMLFIQEAEWEKVSTDIKAIQQDIDHKLLNIVTELDVIAKMEHSARIRTFYELNGYRLTTAIENTNIVIKREEEIKMQGELLKNSEPTLNNNAVIHTNKQYHSNPVIEEKFTELNLHIKSENSLARIKTMISMMNDVEIIEEISYGEDE